MKHFIKKEAIKDLENLGLKSLVHTTECKENTCKNCISFSACKKQAIALGIISLADTDNKDERCTLICYLLTFLQS